MKISNKLFNTILLLLFSSSMISQEIYEVDSSNDNDDKIISIGKKVNNIKIGIWKEFYNRKFWPANKTIDTLFTKYGTYHKGNKVGDWYYLDYKKSKDKTINIIDSIVSYLEPTRSKVYDFNYNGTSINRIKEKTDTLIITKEYKDGIYFKKKLDKINEDSLVSTIQKVWLNKNLTVTKSFEKGIPKTEYFYNDYFKNTTISKFWHKGVLYEERSNYTPNYILTRYYNNSLPFELKEFKKNKLYNVKYYNKKGKELVNGKFKNGNGILKLYEMDNLEVQNIYEYSNGNIIKKWHNVNLKNWTINSPFNMRKEYYKNGSIFLSEEYKDGKLDYVYYTDKNDKSMDNGSFANGTGIINRYNKQNELLKKEHYLKGKLIRVEKIR